MIQATDELQTQIRTLLSQRDAVVLDLIKKHEAFTHTSGHQEQIGESYVNYALYYSMVEMDYDKFFHYAEMAKPCFNLANHRRAAYYYGNIAYCFHTHSKLPESQGCFLRAIKAMEQITDLSVAETKRLASHYYNLYILFGFTDLGTLDRKYIERALELNESVNHKLGLSYNYSALAADLDKQEKFDEALNYTQKRITLSKELNDMPQLSLAYCMAGLLNAKLGNKEVGFEYFEKAKDILETISSVQYQAGYYLEYAEAHFALKEFEIAIDNFQKAHNLYISIDFTPNLSRIYRYLSKAYSSMGNTADALAYQEKYSQTLLDNFKLDKLLAIAAAQNELEHEQQERETSLLKQKNDEIEIYVQQLERSNDELKQFAHAASHDLREPVRMIVSYTDLLEKSLKANINEEQKEFFSYLKDGGKRINEMIAGILAFSKATSIQDDVYDTDLNEVLHSVKDNLKLALTTRNATLQSGQLPTVKGTTTLLIQLFQNLVSNGIKYNQTDSPIIKISVEKKGNHYQFCVSDNGIGIDDVYREKVFDIFTRLQNREQYSGSGIGLAICKKIVERLGGKISNRTNAIGGTDFIFTLLAGS